MHLKNIEHTDVMVLRQPTIALNFVRSTYEDSDSEEVESEPVHPYGPMSEFKFYAKTIFIADDDDDTSSSEKKTRASDAEK